MQATILAGHLATAARIAKMATKRRNTIPVLGNLLLAIEGGALIATGTDMENSISTIAAAQGKLDQITVPAGTLMALVSRLPPETEITLKPQKGLGSLLIEGGGLKASLLALPAGDFPRPNGHKEALRFDIPASSLLRLLNLPSHAISTEETRYYLNGIYLHLLEVEGKQVLRGVATDGHRLMAADEVAPAGIEGFTGGIVPREAVRILRALLPGRTDGMITVRVLGGCVAMAFDAGPWAMTVRLIDGTFPDYQRVIPAAGNAGRITVQAPKALAHSISIAASVAAERSLPLELSNGDGNALRLKARSVDNGEAEMLVPADVASWNEGEPHPTVGLQARYLRAICAALPKGFTLRVKDESAPARIEFPDGVGLLMPMRI